MTEDLKSMISPTFRGSLPTILMVAALAGAATVAIGVPDIGVIRDFMTGYHTTDSAAIVIVGVITWGLIGTALVAVLAGSLRNSSSARSFTQQRWARALFFAGVGGVVFGLGLAHHLRTGYSICCGNIQEAQTLAK